MRGRARLPLEQDLAVDPKVSGFLLGFDLDDEVNVVPDRTQKGLHAEVGALESAAGRKAGGVDLVEWVLPDFIYNNVERNRLGHAVQGGCAGRPLRRPVNHKLLLISFSGRATYLLGSCALSWGGEAERPIEWGECGLRLCPTLFTTTLSVTGLVTPCRVDAPGVRSDAR
jgi:hypothetical protein